VSIYEILVVDEKIREAIHSRVTSTELSEIARNNGMISLLKNGLTKVISGTTTIEEILKATNE
jgi:type II secretory ATPase GspE/PulE/Tfp pilus assembly ATPase PilB-like protein